MAYFILSKLGIFRDVIIRRMFFLIVFYITIKLGLKYDIGVVGFIL